jgi:hypothetical protein
LIPVNDPGDDPGDGWMTVSSITYDDSHNRHLDINVKDGWEWDGEYPDNSFNY